MNTHKKESSDSPPMIFKETPKLLEAQEKDEENLLKMEYLLNQKRAYYEQLEEIFAYLDKTASKKIVGLEIVEDRTNVISRNNSICREKVQKLCNDYNVACQEFNEFEVTLSESEEKIQPISTHLKKTNEQYDKTIDQLSKLFNQLSDKRKNTLEVLELESEKMRKMNQIMETELTVYEKENIFEDEIEMNEEELSKSKNLESLIKSLDEEYMNIDEENKKIECAEKEISTNFEETVLKLKTETMNIANEFPKNLQVFEDQKAIELNNHLKLQTLEDDEKQLDKDLYDSTKIWEKLEKSDYDGFSKIEQEIGQFRTHIYEMMDKCNVAEEEKTRFVESLQKDEQEMKELISETERLVAELNELEVSLNSLPTSEVSNEFDELSKKIVAINSDKVSIQKSISNAEDIIKNVTNQINKEKEEGKLEMLTLENTNLLEMRETEKDYTVVQTEKLNLENKIKQTETQIIEMNQSKEVNKEKLAYLIKANENIETSIKVLNRNVKMNISRRNDIQRKFGNFSAPPPILLKNQPNQTELNRPKTPEVLKPKTLNRPKTPESFKEKIPRKKPVKREHWDSDSTIDGEVIDFKDFIKGNYKRRENSGK